jgi:O-antigen/teichoic acid export membrane protein
MTATPRRLAIGSAMNVANLLVTALVSILMMPFIVHHLGDRMYGIWALVAAVVGYYGLLELGLATAIRRYLGASLGAQNEEESRRVFNTALLLYCGLGLVVLLVTISAALLAPFFTKRPEDAHLFRLVIFLVGLSVSIGFPIRVYRGVLEAHLRFDSAGAFDLLSVLFRTALIVPALLAGYKVVSLAAVTLLSTTLWAFLYISFAHRTLPFLAVDWKYFTRETARRLFSYSVFSLMSQMSDILRFQMDSVVVASFLGLALVTHYSIAGRLAQFYMGTMQAFIGVFATIFSRKDGARDHAGMKKTFFFASKLSLCSASFMGFGLILWSKPFILRWMGPAYSDSYAPLVALVTGYIFALWQAPSVHLLFGISKHKFFAVMNVIEGLANLALSIWLARRIGMLGVAVGTLIPITISKLFVQPVYVCHAAGFKLSEYLALAGKTLGVVLLALIVPFAVTLKFAVPNYKVLFGIAIFSASCYVLIVLRLAFTPDEKRLLWRGIRPRFALKAEAPQIT